MAPAASGVIPYSLNPVFSNKGTGVRHRGPHQNPKAQQQHDQDFVSSQFISMAFFSQFSNDEQKFEERSQEISSYSFDFARMGNQMSIHGHFTINDIPGKTFVLHRVGHPPRGDEVLCSYFRNGRRCPDKWEKLDRFNTIMMEHYQDFFQEGVDQLGGSHPTFDVCFDTVIGSDDRVKVVIGNFAEMTDAQILQFEHMAWAVLAGEDKERHAGYDIEFLNYYLTVYQGPTTDEEVH